MKIAHVVSTFSPQLGGMGKVCADEASALVKAGHEVTVFTLKYNQIDYTEHDKQFPFNIVRLRPLIKFGDAGWVPQLLWRLNTNFDLVHLHYPFYGGAEWLSFIKTQFIITYHMNAQTNGLKLLIQKVYDFVWSKFLFAKAKKIIMVDAALKNTKLLNTADQNKIVEIPNGVNLDIFKPELPDLEKLGISGLRSKKIILFVGNLLPIKRLDLLARAVQLLDNKEIVLLIVGGGNDMARYAQLAKDLKINSQVRFVGLCADPVRLNQHYNAAYCVVIPSDYESFSLVAAEAMACGKPLVLSALPVFKENFSQAIFFEKGSVDSLKNALTRVLSLSEEERKRMSEWGIDKARTDFSWEKHMDKLMQIYNDL